MAWNLDFLMVDLLFEPLEDVGRLFPDIVEKLAAAFSITSPEIEIDLPPPPSFLFQFSLMDIRSLLFKFNKFSSIFF